MENNKNIKKENYAVTLKLMENFLADQSNNPKSQDILPYELVLKIQTFYTNDFIETSKSSKQIYKIIKNNKNNKNNPNKYLNLENDLGKITLNFMLTTEDMDAIANVALLHISTQSLELKKVKFTKIFKDLATLYFYGFDIELNAETRTLKFNDKKFENLTIHQDEAEKGKNQYELETNETSLYCTNKPNSHIYIRIVDNILKEATSIECNHDTLNITKSAGEYVGLVIENNRITTRLQFTNSPSIEELPSQSKLKLAFSNPMGTNKNSMYLYLDNNMDQNRKEFEYTESNDITRVKLDVIQ